MERYTIPTSIRLELKLMAVDRVTMWQTKGFRINYHYGFWEKMSAELETRFEKEEVTSKKLQRYFNIEVYRMKKKV